MNSMHSMTGFWAVAGHTPYSCTMLGWYPRLNIVSWSAIIWRSAAASTCAKKTARVRVRVEVRVRVRVRVRPGRWDAMLLSGLAASRYALWAVYRCDCTSG